ncbi:hypothetical protein M569_08383, partial [Genlisea aurea]
LSPAMSDLEDSLRRAWLHLRLSVRDPDRVPTWDAIVLTAASPRQARLYDWQLNRAKRLGRIASSTVTLAVPDPRGERIGSGAATLNAVRALAQRLRRLSLLEEEEEIVDPSLAEYIREKRVLLLHAGGDSKRIPWANPMGKVFLPLPYMAMDDPDSPVPLLFDHILAVASGARQAFQTKGGMFIMTGDVLPCFDSFSMVLPEDTASIITVPITLDVAANHGVVVASDSGEVNHYSSLALVENLLQKPSIEYLHRHGAILPGGRALLDTGIIAVTGKSWEDLILLSASCQSMVLELLKNKKEISLYEDLVAAWVPAKHEWLKQRPFGDQLVRALGRQRMLSYCAHDLLFLHFGTSSEVLDHLHGAGSGFLGRRHLCSIPATTESDISSSAIIISSSIASRVSIGEESLVYDSTISSGVQIGSQSIVVGLRVPEVDILCAGNSFRFILPDRHCLWEVPLLGRPERVIVYCCLHDNPKDSISDDGTFCGRRWTKFFADLGISDSDIWDSKEMNDKSLWNAKIFPVLPYTRMLELATWLMGLRGRSDEFLFLWRSSDRLSLADVHRSIDFSDMWSGSMKHQMDIARGIVTSCLNFGLMRNNIFQICQEIFQQSDGGIEVCKTLLSVLQNSEMQHPQILPKSRAHQVHLDLLRACRNEDMAAEVENKVWAAVSEETASAVRYDSILVAQISRSLRVSNVKVELPVRVDFVGGWSDTPPWSLERSGCVLNMAIKLGGSLPVGASVDSVEEAGILITDDAGNELHVKNASSVCPPFHPDDPFRLVKSALFVTDAGNELIAETEGFHIKTWADVPRGSGLGTSSILLAAVVKALLGITGRDDRNESVARLVLVCEQVMGTGGGWQDQIGGLYPGIKCTLSYPGVPLRLRVNPVMASTRSIEELQQRLLVVFTGQVRVAHHVLQNVVIRYLRRDSILIGSIKRLAGAAKRGREALMNGDLDELGEVMAEGWRLHQELDPLCSNRLVDEVFQLCRPYSSGYKLAGAGGGGFALILAKNVECGRKLRSLLADFDLLRVYDWEI